MVFFAIEYHAIPPVLPLIISQLGPYHAHDGLFMVVLALPDIFLGILSMGEVCWWICQYYFDTQC
jgi:hypothetical protein